MKILMVNKFLYPKGGAETYCLELGEYLESQGHQVQFFGMQDKRNIVGNQEGLYVSNVDFKNISLRKVFYPLRTLYSIEAKIKIRKLLKKYRPDIVHLNNYNFQITPSILYEIKRHNIPVVSTLHDFQIVCPNHMMYIEHENRICEECRGRKYGSCIKNRCIHNSRIKSILGAIEGYVFYKLKTYENLIDSYIAPSNFLKNKIVEFGEQEDRIITLYNFTKKTNNKSVKKGEYILYFGRLSIQKGIRTMIEACKRLPDANFVFAGSGDLQDVLTGIDNITFVGFKSGDELKKLVSEALFTVCPSEWYENCPMSVLESQMYGTPVIGANIGGIPELVDDKVDGLLFEPGNVEDLSEKIRYLNEHRDVLQTFSQRCVEKTNDFSIDLYYSKLIEIYESAIQKYKR